MPHVIDQPVKELMEDSYYDYSMSVITDRALPDLRDGLKPVHRRILYAMHESNNTHNRPYKKSARMVGDVIGKYHPHGDTSVYDASVRMAQPYSLRHVLIDGQGNFGSIDGDSAAAMRYTEMRLPPLAGEMFNDLHKETIEWEENYDGQEKMPEVLTVPFPNLLVNGVDGIAVGMATFIPPHNLRDVCTCAITLIDQGDLTSSQMIQILQGPDLPTGAIIHSMSGFKEAVVSGKGKVMMRSKHIVEDRGRGATRLVITEIPYQVNKSRLIEKIAALYKAKEIEGITELRDESNKDGIRIAIDLKSGEDAEVMFSILCSKTSLEESINYNCTVLDHKVPVRLGLLDILKKWLIFRKEVVKARYVFERKQALADLHILEGYMKAVGMMDQVIATIRSSKDGAEAKTGLMALLGTDEIQTQSILNLRLQRLTGMEVNTIRADHDALVAKIADLTAIIECPEKIALIIKEELEKISAKYGEERRTEIKEEIGALSKEDFVEREDVLITITKNGYIKRMPADVMVKQNRGVRGKRAMDIGDGDEVNAIYNAHSHDMLMVFAKSGQVYGVKCYQIPEGALGNKGRHIKNIIEGLDEEIASILRVPEDISGKSIIVVTADGTIKRSSLDTYAKATRKGGINGLTLTEGNSIVDVFVCQPYDHLMLVSDEGSAIRINLELVRDIGRTATGVCGMKMDEESCIVGAYVIAGDGTEPPLHQVQRVRNGELVPVEEPDTSKMDDGKFLVCIGENGVGKRTPVSDFSVQSRGGKGVNAFKTSRKTGSLAAAFGATLENDVVIFASDGRSNRISVESIREAARATSGVILMNISTGQKVVSVALAIHQEEDEVDSENQQKEENV
ncbi:MAG: DNA gyrase subunit A [Sulfurimonas sp.]|jgi:DNA gyrase subunit A